MTASVPMSFIKLAANKTFCEQLPTASKFAALKPTQADLCFFLNIDENKTHMEENKFARLKAALQQAKEACEISPEDKEFQQEYELAKEALKQAQKEVREGKTLYLFVISLYTVLIFSSSTSCFWTTTWYFCFTAQTSGRIFSIIICIFTFWGSHFYIRGFS